MPGSVRPIPLLALSAVTSLFAQPQPLTLDQVVQEALSNNLGLIAERQNVPIAKAREITASLRPNPVLTFAWDYLDWLRRGLTVENSAGPSEWHVQFDYVLEGMRKRERRMELARLVTSVADLRLLDSVRLLSLNVRVACVDYLLAKENLSLAHANLGVFNNILKVNEAKVKAGEQAGVELIRTRVAREQLENAVHQAELRRTIAANNLQQLMGRKTMDPSFDLSGAFTDGAVVAVLEELRAAALDQRPDLRAALKDTQRARADISLQQANARPDYTLSSLYHHQYGYSNGRTFGVVFATPLPLTNRNQGEIARATRETYQTELQVKALQNTISTEVDNAYQQLMTAQNLVGRIRQNLLADAKQVRDITEYSYRRGEASFLEFLDAQRAFNDAQQSYNDARADYQRSLYLIDAVTGKSVTP